MAENTPERSSILARTAMGAGWMFAWRLATRILGLVSTLVLVRLLSPNDFGLVALAFAFATTLEAVLAIGIEQQIVRARETSRDLYDTIFTMNSIRGALLAALVMIGAGPAARFFDEPRLEAVAQALALVPLLAGFANVGVTEFSRNLEFTKVFKMMIVPRVLQIIVTLAAAFLLQSYWALVVGAVSGRLFSTLITYFYHSYRPRFSLLLWRELLGISFWTWGINVASAVRDRTETILIGRLLGVREVGLYIVSVEIAALPTTELANPISQVSMPGLAASLRTQERHESGLAFLRIFGLTLLVSLPAAFGISLIAGPVVALALGQGWHEAVSLIAILGVGYGAIPVLMIATALLNAQSRFRQIILFIMVGILLRFVGVITLAPSYGLNGLAIAVGIALLGEAALLTAACLRQLGLKLLNLLQVTWRPLLAVATMTALLWSLGLGWAETPPDISAAAIAGAQAVLLGAVTYVSVLGALWWLARRPPGAETDLLSFLYQLLEAASARLSFLARRLGLP